MIYETLARKHSVVSLCQINMFDEIINSSLVRFSSNLCPYYTHTRKILKIFNGKHFSYSLGLENKNYLADPLSDTRTSHPY